ncbi:hypothetical protein O181_053617 [Austropuccinia psidii MF-1]|uniref:4a-hydroxytetrahydrobiopterin dehydratase n=1 Tax=Austropuccinia psidii MF-1 TaxID=1389203 RepID=A0A9Q3EA06_9BASI|nr:hypothetical protein [Austropuccinia psidii MF-1]
MGARKLSFCSSHPSFSHDHPGAWAYLNRNLDGIGCLMTQRFQSIGSDCHQRDPNRPLKSKLLTIYSTKEEIEKAFKKTQNSSLTSSGWKAIEIHKGQERIWALEKEWIDHFKSWDHVLCWVRDSVGPIANELNHHPEVSITDYKNLKLTLFTHSLKGVTPRDFRLALRIDQLKTVEEIQ